jgi:hypothetical protein
MAEIKNWVVKEVEKLSLFFLKKSTDDDCIMPRETRGARSIRLLENKLKRPLSVGVRYSGLVNSGIKMKETPLEKKLVSMNTPTDLLAEFLTAALTVLRMDINYAGMLVLQGKGNLK